MTGLAREPRWGRSEEEMGEDPFLAGELASHMVQGMTGAGRNTTATLSDGTTVAPLVKHYAVYSIGESGRNAAPAHAGRREVQETFLPVFEKAFKAGAQGAMSSYNEVDGVPTTSDHWLLTTQARDEFGFEGYICSDFGAITGLGKGNHAVAATDEECVQQFIEAGGSMNGHDFGDQYEIHAANLVKSGKMTMATLDKAAGAILKVKARLGMIPVAFGGKPDDALVDATLVATNLGDNPKHVAAAIRAAKESVVMLMNEKNTLPLDATKVKKLLVLGPNADEVRTGDYSAAGWAGGAPNGGGNIDNKNMQLHKPSDRCLCLLGLFSESSLLVVAGSPSWKP